MAAFQALVSIRTFKKQAPEQHSCEHVCSRSLVHLVIKTSCVCHFSILLHTHLLNIAGSLRVAAPFPPPPPPPKEKQREGAFLCFIGGRVQVHVGYLAGCYWPMSLILVVRSVSRHGQQRLKMSHIKHVKFFQDLLVFKFPICRQTFLELNSWGQHPSSERKRKICCLVF